jgi:hypothetical protein
MTWPGPQSCERARFLAALAPDLVLTDVEERQLSRHLRACAPCSAFAGSVADFTVELREAPAIEPTLSVPLLLDGVRRRHRLSIRTSLVALASTATVVLVASVLMQPQSGRTPATAPRPPVLIHAAPEDETAALREFRDLALARLVNQEPQRGQPGMYVG